MGRTAQIKGVLKQRLIRQQLPASKPMVRWRQPSLRLTSPNQGTCMPMTPLIVRGQVTNMTTPLQACRRRGLQQMT